MSKKLLFLLSIVSLASLGPLTSVEAKYYGENFFLKMKRLGQSPIVHEVQPPVPTFGVEFCKNFTSLQTQTACLQKVEIKGHITLEEKIIFEKHDRGLLDREFCNQAGSGKELQKFCRKKLAEQKKYFHDKAVILDRARTWSLDEETCHNQSIYDNFRLCQQQLYFQNSNCKMQKTAGHNMIVDLENQLLFAVKDCRLVAFTRIISGKNATPTRTGIFQIYEKRGPHKMQATWYVEKAFYYSGDYAIHDADSWRTQPRYWETSWRPTGGSHGCINTPRSVMEVLWDEFSVGDTVHVYPSLPADIATELWAKVGSRQPVDPSVARS